MQTIPKNIIIVCKQKLIETKRDLLDRIRTYHVEYGQRDRGGDEMDLVGDQLAESQYVSTNERLRQQILEIEWALAKIEMGTYGVCEETEETIETERLLAIPWTRLSIEGAELREALSKKFAR
jgi:DnaK suppressor protein